MKVCVRPHISARCRLTESTLIYTALNKLFTSTLHDTYQLYDKTTDFNTRHNMDESRCDAERQVTTVSLETAEDALVQLDYNCYFSLLRLQI